ncbi:hypothetical protein SELMODRAFT_414754 [Selaginella moellendorffii]|uniref:RING-type E3 ubiquitin transferase n=2 Tax=Selaginella moellendorffii TaxID=88036 RepID=D8RTU7_SELML|nr:hypothetical protein SELMODRAFT_414754 [Selaginella moellendorffii]
MEDEDEGGGEEDCEEQRQRQNQAAPALFLCPISLEIMRDPVIVCTGQTYDRPSIEKWIRDGHRSCPITMLHLHDLTLIPNIIVRQLIEAWCSKEESASAMFAPSPPSPPPPPFLLAHHDFSPQESLDLGRRERVLGLLRRIAKGQDVRQSVATLKSMAKEELCGSSPTPPEAKKVCSCIVEAGGALLMASMLADELIQHGTALHGSPDGFIQHGTALHGAPDGFTARHEDSPCEEIMSLLALLCRGASREVIGAVLSESGALQCVVCHLGSAQIDLASRMSAAVLLKRLLATEEMRVEVGQSTQFFHGLLDLIDSSSSKKGLVKLLHLACSHKPNRSTAVEEGAIQILVNLLLAASSPPSSSSSSGEDRGLETTERALATLEQLCTVEQGRRAVCESTAAVHCAVRLLVGYSRPATEHATGLLLLVCQSGPVQVVQIAMRAGARRQLLLLLQSDCTGRAKKRALELLKLFHAIFFVQGDEHASSDFKNVDLY